MIECDGAVANGVSISSVLAVPRSWCYFSIPPALSKRNKEKSKMYLFVAAVVQTSGALSWPLATCSNASFPTNLNKLKASVPITEEGIFLFLIHIFGKKY